MTTKKNEKYYYNILDLDETLIHSETVFYENYDFYFKLNNSLFFCKKRPYLDLFLKYCFKHYRVAIWSAGKANYVNLVCNNLFFNKPYQPEFIWSRNKCTFIDSKIKRLLFPNKNYLYYKKLEKICKKKEYNIDSKNILIIDDNKNTYKQNIRNAINLLPFDDVYNKNDMEFFRLIILLDKLENVPDVTLYYNKLIKI